MKQEKQEKWFDIYWNSGKSKYLERLSLCDLGINLNTILVNLQYYKDEYGNDYKELRLDLREFYEYGNQYPNHEYVLQGLREETDEEVQERIDKEEKIKKSIEDRERAQYKKLQKKYG